MDNPVPHSIRVHLSLYDHGLHYFGAAYLVLLVKSAARPRRSFRPKFWKGNEAKLANSSCFRGGPQVSELAATRGVVNAMVRMKMNEMNTIRQWCLPVFHTCSTVCLSTVLTSPYVRSVRVGSAEVLFGCSGGTGKFCLHLLPLTTRAFEQKQLLLTIHIISAPKLI